MHENTDETDKLNNSLGLFMKMTMLGHPWQTVLIIAWQAVIINACDRLIRVMVAWQAVEL